ncbi:ERCC4 domain-containing protein [Nitrosococcus wardiae]|uniref:ERCC4 domain-containing protein n=1 Tax=Nitrosococcus wardiae TaxID=1814290 RepID=UPI0023EA698B|nr:ERCC4 domain-containing protein [Nitrosococcus wardiae]
MDDREANCGPAAVLAAMEGMSIKFQRLPLGDYLIDNRLLAERKTLMDLIASIQDGRLFRQGCRLATSQYRTVILLEGTTASLADNKMSREAIQGAIITLTLILGIPLLRSRHSEESAKLLIYAAQQMRRVATGALPRKGRRPKGKRRTQLTLLQGLPGIGPERARQLLAHFGSVEAILNAQLEELMTVPGIGKGVARDIRWAVNEGETEYSIFNDPVL